MNLSAHWTKYFMFGTSVWPPSCSRQANWPSSKPWFADRQSVNEWIRAAGHFDAVVDFDRVFADPQHPDHLLPPFDCGDHLHPSPAGYKAMADPIPLSFFAQ